MPDPAPVVAVVVTYEPVASQTERLLRALAPQVGHLVVVDNGSTTTDLADVRATTEELGGELVALRTNTGIAAAQNVGIEHARRRGAGAVLLSDQDSAPAPDMVRRLTEALDEARAAGRRVAAVGPVIVDARNPGAVLNFSDQRWGPRRAALTPGAGRPVPLTFLLASGCLVPLDALDAVGGMDESLFIDHVDLEWGLRARRAGWELLGVPDALLHHALGDRTQRIPGRSRDVHLHSPVRNYYMVRNTLALVRTPLMRPAWRVGYVAWIVKYAAFYTLAVRPRLRRARWMTLGALDAARRRSGAWTPPGSPVGRP